MGCCVMNIGKHPTHPLLEASMDMFWKGPPSPNPLILRLITSNPAWSTLVFTYPALLFVTL